MLLSSNDKLGLYQILAPLGVGGMGEVYRALDTRLGREVALKILPAEMAKDPDRLARFQREARAVAALNHPNVVTLFSVEHFDDFHFLTMELVEGHSLAGMIPEEGFPAVRIIEMAISLAEALAAAHDKGLVHRDLKPANIMLTRDERIKVLDFGLAKDLRNSTPTEATVTTAGETQMGVVMGTPPYMSPEQISGRSLDYRTDIFSLGIILHEMTTGHRPFQGTTSVELAVSILRDTPPPITRTDLPAALPRLIEKCLAKNPTDRIQSSRQLAQELTQLRLNNAYGSEITHAALPVAADEGFWIAVLPFKSKSANADVEELADGLSEAVVTGLSRFSYLRVIASTSTSRYASESSDIRSIGAQLGARYVMEGSLRQAGTKMRLAVQLVDATNGVHLWVETYERSFSPDAIFELQDELVPRIVSTIADMNGALPRSMSEAVRSRNPEHLSAHEAVIRSFGYFERVTPEELAAARSGLEQAVQKEPANADAWAMLAMLCAQDYGQGFMLQPDCLRTSLTAARRAVELAPSSSWAHLSLAQALFFLKEIQGFRNAAERAAALNPMDGNSIAFLGEMLFYSGYSERGLELASRAKQLNPNHPGWYWYIDFFDAYAKGDYSSALDFTSRVNLPNHFAFYIAIAAAAGQLGHHDAAAKALRVLLQMMPTFAINVRAYSLKWWNPDFAAHLIEGLRKAGLEIPGT